MSFRLLIKLIFSNMRRNVRLGVVEVKRKGLCPPVEHIERLIKKVV